MLVVAEEAEHLRREVVLGAADGVVLSDFAVEEGAESNVTDLEEQVFLVEEEDVVGLDVAMSDAKPLKVHHGLDHGQHEISHFVIAEFVAATLVEVGSEALDTPFHDDATVQALHASKLVPRCWSGCGFARNSAYSRG